MNRAERIKLARALAQQIRKNIASFDRRCAAAERTDTAKAWKLLRDCADRAIRAARLLR